MNPQQPGQDDDAPVKLGPQKARAATRNPMAMRVLLLSLFLVVASFIAAYVIFGL